MVDDPQRSSPGALHHLARALKEVSGRVHRVGGIAELITRLQHKTLTCHPELRPPRDKGEDQMHRMRVFAPRPLWRVGLDGNVAIPARGPLRSDRIAVEGYREFALAEGRQSAVLRSDGERRGKHGSQASDEGAALHRFVLTAGGMVSPQQRREQRTAASRFAHRSPPPEPGVWSRAPTRRAIVTAM